VASRRLTAVSALLLAMGLSAAAATPFVAQGASAAVVRLDPGVEPPCDENGVCENPEVTVTVTTTLPTPTQDGPTEVTVTQTVTAKPTKTSKSPKASKTPTPTPTPQPQVESQPPPLTQPTQAPIVPSTSQAPEETVQLPSVAPETSIPTTETTPSEVSEQVQLEARNAQPEFDQSSLTRNLAIPALVLVLLALFAVLVFEGRLRKMAHAAAVRKAGPQAPPGDVHGYPAGPGFAGPYQGHPGMAYAPIISLVPVQTYPTVHMPYGQAHSDPAAYGHQGYPDPAMYPQQPVPHYEPEPVYQEPEPVYQPEPAPAHHHEPEPVADYRDPFEPAVPVADIPPGGDAPYQEQHVPAPADEHGDGLPWDDGTVIYELPDRTIEDRRPEHDR
jgi:outer membrane biosynthesis protein TonB